MDFAVCAGFSGVGVQNARRHVSELLGASKSKPTALLVCGFAGALGVQKAGDIMIAQRVLDCTTGVGMDTEFLADSRLLATAESLHLRNARSYNVTLATTDRILIDRKEKQAFLQRCSYADCVDMETAGAVQVARDRGIPWLAVRSVTDGFDDTMPLDFNALTDDEGSVALRRVIGAVLRHPAKIPGLMALGRRSSFAADSLSTFLLKLLPSISGSI